MLVATALGAVLQARDTPEFKSEKNLADLTIEQLMNESITSVSKKEQKLGDAAAAITVLSNDDLHRSGAPSITDALRLIPGMDVSQINSSLSAVSARGFNETHSRSLLVLVDGRAVYSPLDAGVTWDLQQQMLEDVDRVEVIRGPGGTLWGANAVNGVVNIVTKSARDTQGTLLYGSGGDVHSTSEGVRYGGKINENTYYRVFGSYQKNRDYTAPDGTPSGTGWQGGQGGFRIDHYSGSDTHSTWQGDFTRNVLSNHADSDYNFNTLGRWSRTLSDRSSVELQVYFDRLDNKTQDLYETITDSVDLSAQHNFSLSERNNVIWGLTYRSNFITAKPGPNPALVRDPHFAEQISSLFVQDEFKFLPDKLTLTAGTKFEYNTVTGLEYQPSVRGMFKPTNNQTWWAAVSRSVITPSYRQAHDTLLILFGPPSDDGVFAGAVGNPHVKSSIEWSYEAGYRIQPAKRVSLDVAAYFNQYRRLISTEDTGTTIPFPLGLLGVNLWNNTYNAQTYGGEASVTVEPVDEWKLIASYSLLHAVAYGRLVDTDAIGGSPQQQLGLRSAYDFTKRTSLDAQIRYVGSIADVPAYITADVRISYRPTDNLEFALGIQNLGLRKHLELGPNNQSVVAEVPRNFSAKIIWHF